jgi:DNA polymerase-3 subunit delta'
VSNAEILPWQERQWRQVVDARQADRMPHALLLAGCSGLGKSQFATRLSRALVCTAITPSGEACGRCRACHLSATGGHPDQLLVQPEEPGKAIKIDAIRQLGGKSVLAAQEHGHRVIVIDPADAMNRAAANALLKTLEEPASRTVLILVSSHADRLPPTIRSRCRTIKFPVPRGNESRAWLEQKVDSSSLDALLAITGGAPLQVLRAADEGWSEIGNSMIAELQALRLRKANPLRVVEDWQKRPLTLLLDSLKRCLADILKVGSGLGAQSLYLPDSYKALQTLSQDIDLQLVFRLSDDVMHAERALANNLNVAMMLEHLAMRWLEITRPRGR